MAGTVVNLKSKAELKSKSEPRVRHDVDLSKLDFNNCPVRDMMQ